MIIEQQIKVVKMKNRTDKLNAKIMIIFTYHCFIILRKDRFILKKY